MPPSAAKASILLCILAMAAFLRFYKLGDWPFANDELATVEEERAFYSNDVASSATQKSRLPRIIPLSYYLHQLNNSLFGRDEFGSRILMATFGAASVGAAFLLLDPLMGRPTAIATALLLAMWPEHIFQSQQTRYYIIVSFFSFLAILLGAYATRRPTVPLATVVCCLILFAVLCHTLMSVLLVLIFTGIVAGLYVERKLLPKSVALLFLLTGLILAAFYFLYLKPLLSNWNSEAEWGYGVVHSLLASVNSIGWTVALLAALGLLLWLKTPTAMNRYWSICTLGWIAASAVLPLVVSYHPAYVFPLSIGIIVAAGNAVGTIYEQLRVKGSVIGVAWVGLACLGTFPSLVSHYLDGSRPDFRNAARFVESQWKTGDRVAGYSIGLIGYYAPDCKPAIPLPLDSLDELRKIADGKGRVWLVLQSSRSGLPDDISHWLGANCSHELKVRRTRYDYADYSVDVFLFTPT
jgi:4-amino-4-deoxy-L-arabinose transferase-like glycosyltransferase